MTVLWILLGLLAALLLLLCCPVTLRLSWWPAAASKRDEPSGYLTEQVERDLEQLGLAPEDELQLRRLIQGLPDPPPQQPQKELRLTLHCLFLRLTLYPQKPKPPKEPKPACQEKEAAAGEAGGGEEGKAGHCGNSQDDTGDCKLRQKAAGDGAGRPVPASPAAVRRGGPAGTARRRRWTRKNLCRRCIPRWQRRRIGSGSRHADIRLRPDFSGGEESSWAVRLRLSFHPIVMLAAALRFAFCLLRLLLAQKKKEQPEEPEKQTA